ncbi:hypothetical protein JTB14_001840 [Gonioctena quinquepunctata]|nr:hypothetical protein JTB14_001840 [Gonioctena quinquepunctata]
MNGEEMEDLINEEFVIGTVNIQGLKNKRLQVQNLSYTFNIQVLGIVETLIKTTPNFSGYSAISKEKSQFSRGICLLVRHGIAYKKHELPRVFENVDCLAVDILENGETTTFIAFYNRHK